ncbi:MAG: hypothetical protein HY033_13275 [Ignavibacteriae bacterium]|nr:hypothetical protein [Ignavibacteria bacterium]MBI3365864.1 hypothetical protein [Ignavibacteriota bacterium]
MMGRIQYKPTLYLLLLVCVLSNISCQRASNRRRLKAEMESIKKESTKSAPNPYKLGQGTKAYDAQRDALGNLDSAASPPEPVIPNH